MDSLTTVETYIAMKFQIETVMKIFKIRPIFIMNFKTLRSSCYINSLSVFTSIVLHPGSSYLTPILASDIIPLQTPTCLDAATLTDLSIQPTLSFCIELFTNNNDAIQFYTGFESYDMLISCFKFLGDNVNHLQYKDTSTESSTTFWRNSRCPKIIDATK